MDRSGHRFEVLSIKARTKAKQALRLLSIGTILFGAWTMLTESALAQAKIDSSEVLSAIPPQTLVNIAYFDGLILVGVGAAMLFYLTR